MLYLDAQSKILMSPATKQAYIDALEELSIESLYQKNLVFIKKYWSAIETIRELLGISSEAQFIPMGSSSEAIHHLLYSMYFDVIYKTGKNHIVTLASEDADLLLSLNRLENFGVVNSVIPIDVSGSLSLETLKQTIGKKTALVSFSLANRLTGVIQPFEEIIDFCKRENIYVHVDITSAIGNHLVDIKALGADFITFEGSRIGAPNGIAGLINATTLPLSSIVPSSIEGTLQGGPIPAAKIIALALALEEKVRNLDCAGVEIAILRNRLEKTIKEDMNAQVFFEKEHRLPNVCCFAISGIHAELLLFALAQQDIFISIGGGLCQRLSNLLSSFGYPHSLAQAAISLSFDHLLTQEHCERFLQCLAEITRKYIPLSIAIHKGLDHE